MSGLEAILVGVLLIWMLACAWSGFRTRFKVFAIVFIGGMAANQLWMMFGLNAAPLEPHLLVAQISAGLFAISAMGMGWLAGRVHRQWRITRVEDAGV